MFNKSEKEIMINWGGHTIPLVSICCTAYMNEAHITEALDSILAQETTFPFEILVRDDASPDGTADIINAYYQKFPTIIKPLLESENQYSKGVKALPVTFSNAKGKYIAICQADDYWNDTAKLQQQVDFLENNPDYVITYHDTDAVIDNNIVKADLGGAKRDLNSIELQQCTPLYTLTVCFRNVIGTYPPELYSSRFIDLFLWSLLGAHGKGKYMGQIQPARYRIHSGGVFSSQSKKEKYEMSMSTDASLFIYYSHRKNQDLSHFFKHKLVEDWIRSESTTSLLSLICNYHLTRFKGKFLRKIDKIKHFLKN